MLIHQMRRANVEKNSIDNFDTILGNLPSGFNRAFFPARERLLEVLGFSATDTFSESTRYRMSRNDVLRAELIITASHVFVVEIIELNVSPSSVIESMRRGHTEQHAQLDNARLVLDLDCFGPDVTSVPMDTMIDFINSHFSVALEPHYYPSARMQELKVEGRVPPPKPSLTEMAASKILTNGAARALAIAVRQAGGLLKGDLARQLPAKDRERTDDLRNSLENSGILLPETVVICKKSGSQVVVVPELTAIDTFAQAGFRCPCGNAINQEKVDVAYSISDNGNQLLDGNHWFTVLLIEHLLNFGVPLEDILIDQVSGGDEMDCIASIEGETVLFELKAKEFNLGNAYSFGAKIGILEPDYPVIITTEHVGADAREHFARARRRRHGYSDEKQEPDVTYIEGIDDLGSKLEKFIQRIIITKLRPVLPQMMFAATLPVSAIEKLIIDRYTV